MPGDADRPPGTLGGSHIYAITDRPGVRLGIGVPAGRVRPALWMEYQGTSLIVAQFHGEQQAAAVVGFLDAMMGSLNRAIDKIEHDHTQGDDS